MSTGASIRAQLTCRRRWPMSKLRLPHRHEDRQIVMWMGMCIAKNAMWLREGILVCVHVVRRRVGQARAHARMHSHARTHPHACIHRVRSNATTHARKQSRTQARTHANTHARTHAHYPRPREHTNACTHAQARTHAHARTQPRMHACAHVLADADYKTDQRKINYRVYAPPARARGAARVHACARFRRWVVDDNDVPTGVVSQTVKKGPG